MLLPLPRRLEMSYQNIPNLSSEPPVNFINFVKSDNSLLMGIDLAFILVFQSPKSDRNHRFYSLLHAFKCDQRLILL